MSQFPLQDYVSIYTYRKEHYIYKVDCFPDVLMPVALRLMILIRIGVAPITQLRTCVIKIVTFKGGHLMW